MRLTPLDIKKQDFKRVMRGVDAEEVQAFLQMVADQWEDLAGEQNRLEHKITELETKLEHYKQVEEALQEAVKTARESSRQTLEAAKNKAQSIVDAASESAERIQRKAQEDHYDLRRDIQDLRSRRIEALARLRSLLRAELDVLEEFDRQYPVSTEPAPEPARASIPSDSNAVIEVDEEQEAVQDIAELEAVAQPSEVSIEDEPPPASDSDDTLVFTAGDRAEAEDAPFERPMHIPVARPGSETQPGEHTPPARRESQRDSTEMDKIRKILDDLA